jgi:eukaryotic-like serine/threonine-protein kinase
VGVRPTFNIDPGWLAGNFSDLTQIQALGQGGQKLVYSAAHPTEGKVVLKIFQPTQSVDSIQREMLAVQQVQSPHVPQIYAQGTVGTPLGPAYWFREQRIEGKSLRERLQQDALSDLEALRLGKEILDALVRAEHAAIVHRDVKPDNIMIDNTGKSWLLDFGLARHLSLESLTMSGAQFGKMTLGYAPPEQMRNDKRSIDARADLFGLGVTLFEASTGSNPFRAGARDAAEIVKRVENMPLPPLVLGIVDAASYRDLVSSMTQKRRDQRPPSAAEAAAWIGDVCTKNGL